MSDTAFSSFVGDYKNKFYDVTDVTNCVFSGGVGGWGWGWGGGGGTGGAITQVLIVR